MTRPTLTPEPAFCPETAQCWRPFWGGGGLLQVARDRRSAGGLAAGYHRLGAGTQSEGGGEMHPNVSLGCPGGGAGALPPKRRNSPQAQSSAGVPEVSQVYGRWGSHPRDRTGLGSPPAPGHGMLRALPPPHGSRKGTVTSRQLSLSWVDRTAPGLRGCRVQVWRWGRDDT